MFHINILRQSFFHVNVSLTKANGWFEVRQVCYLPKTSHSLLKDAKANYENIFCTLTISEKIECASIASRKIYLYKLTWDAKGNEDKRENAAYGDRIHQNVILPDASSTLSHFYFISVPVINWQTLPKSSSGPKTRPWSRMFIETSHMAKNLQKSRYDWNQKDVKQSYRIDKS